MRSLNVIAGDIARDWNKPLHAKPYLEAMFALDTMDDVYFCDSARSVVSYFLANASGWRGEKARAIKKELNGMLNA